MNNKTEIWVSFNYGGWSIVFSKIFFFHFTPFYDMVLFEDNDEIENRICFSNDDYCRTEIEYRTKEMDFLVDIRNVWKLPVTDETIDNILDIFTKFNWERKDITNITDLKELMNRNYKR